MQKLLWKDLQFRKIKNLEISGEILLAKSYNHVNVILTGDLEEFSVTVPYTIMPFMP